MVHPNLQPDQIVVIVGPTASGKSEVAMELAKLTGGEIVSADSMSIYRGLDIGTAKPSLSMRSEVKHHLLDIVEPSEEFSAALFQKIARGSIDDIISRNVVPIVVGGSGLYLQAIVDDLNFGSTPPDLEMRSILDNRMRSEGAEGLMADLANLDRKRASSLDSKNPRRVIRALEVAVGKGEVVAELWSCRQHYQGADFFGLSHNREEVRSRIESRVDTMFDSGLVEEVRTLLESGIKFSRTATKAIGYGEVLSALAGDMSVDEAKEIIKKRTKAFAKRQMTWFNKDKRIKWIPVKDGVGPHEIASSIIDDLLVLR